MENKTCPISGTIYSGIGGQAVMEGVMMRNKDDYAVAVRRADGEIVVKKDEYRGVIDNKTIYRIPVVRGVLSFIDSMVLGLSTLNFSSDIYIKSEEEKEKREKGITDTEDQKDPGKRYCIIGGYHDSRSDTCHGIVHGASLSGKSSFQASYRRRYSAFSHRGSDKDTHIHRIYQGHQPDGRYKASVHVSRGGA